MHLSKRRNKMIDQKVRIRYRIISVRKINGRLFYVIQRKFWKIWITKIFFNSFDILPRRRFGICMRFNSLEQADAIIEIIFQKQRN